MSALQKIKQNAEKEVTDKAANQVTERVSQHGLKRARGESRCDGVGEGDGVPDALAVTLAEGVGEGVGTIGRATSWFSTQTSSRGVSGSQRPGALAGERSVQ